MKFNQKYLVTHLKKFKNVSLSFPFGKEVYVFSFNNKMFALIEKDKTPIRLSLKCDPKLSTILRERYEEVMPGINLNQRYWNTILITGQLSEKEIEDLIRHSYELIKVET